MAIIYTIEEALVGKAYRSRSIEGIIQFAEKRNNLYYENAQAYAVLVRSSNPFHEEWRTIAVSEN